MSHIKHIDNITNTAYGEVETSKNSPFVSGNAVYGFIPSNFRTFVTGAGTATVSGNVFQTTSGTTLGDYGVIRSFRSINYKTGQSAVVRFGARFPDNLALTWSGVGAFNIGDEFSFGYSGTTFGIWHRYNGLAEVRKLTLTVGAGGAETATVTINSVVFNIPLTAGTVQHNAYEISAYLNANQSLFECEQLNDAVIIDFLSDGAKAGTYSISSTGTATGTYSTLTTGVTKTSNHIAQADWNGAIPSGFDPSKGNNYKIKYQNGYGNADFFIENSEGEYLKVHTIKWANSSTFTNLLNPSLRIGLYCYSIGATSAVTVQCAYITGLISGQIARIRNPRGLSNTKTISTTNTNIITFRSSRTFNGFSNQVEIDPISVSLVNDGTKNAIFELVTNATLSGDTNFQSVGNNLITHYDVTGGTVSGGTVIATFPVAKASDKIISLSDYDIRIPPDLTITIAGKQVTGGAAADLTAGLTWYEDI